MDSIKRLIDKSMQAAIEDYDEEAFSIASAADIEFDDMQELLLALAGEAQDSLMTRIRQFIV